MTVLVVAPHPDDESIGAAIWMHRHLHDHVYVLHLTDGSPRNNAKAEELGFRSRRDYAAARRRELIEALALIGIPPSHCLQCSMPDGDVYLHPAAPCGRQRALIAELHPSLVLSPGYEGGDPDYDAAAFAVAAARQSETFEHWEFPLYHPGPAGQIVTGRFLHSDQDDICVRFSAQETALKSEILDCFVTQRDMLQHFETQEECFRPSPAYDFSESPCPGRELLYERWGLDVSGAVWREAVGDQLRLSKC